MRDGLTQFPDEFGELGNPSQCIEEQRELGRKEDGQLGPPSLSSSSRPPSLQRPSERSPLLQLPSPMASPSSVGKGSRSRNGWRLERRGKRIEDVLGIGGARGREGRAREVESGEEEEVRMKVTESSEYYPWR